MKRPSHSTSRVLDHQINSRKDGYRQYLKAIGKHWDVLRARYKVKEIGIFGSAVRGEQRKRSDVDVLVEYEELPDLLEFINLENYLEGVLKRKVDLVEKQALRPELKDQILGEVVYL